MRRFLLAALLIVQMSAAFAQDAKPAKIGDGPYPRYEDYLVNGYKLGRYVDDALNFLRKHPHSRYAPRVAADIWQVAVSANDEQLGDRMVSWLLFDHPQNAVPKTSIVKSFAKAEDFRKFIAETVDERLKKGDRDIAHSFTRAIRQGLRTFGNKVLSNRTFLLKTYCMAQVSGDQELRDCARRELEADRRDDDTQKLVDLCLQANESTKEKALKIYNANLEKDDFFLRFFLLQLPPKDRNNAKMVAIRAYLAMLDKQYKAALRLLMPQAEPTAQQLYWMAVAFWAEHKTHMATASFDRLQKEYPQSIWTKTSSDYVDLLAQPIRPVAERIYTALMEGHKDFEAIQASTLINLDNGKQLRVYLYLNLKTNSFHLSLFRETDLFVGYKGDVGRSFLYLNGDTHIRLLNSDKPLMPVPILNLKKNEDGGYLFNFNVNLSSIDVARQQGKKLFSSSEFRSLEEFQQLLERFLYRSLYIPELTKEGNLTFYALKLRKPEYWKYHLRFNKGKVQNFTGKSFSVSDIRYGTAETVEPVFPNWPKLPIVRLADDAQENKTTFMNIWMAVMQFFMEADKSPAH